MNCSEIERVIVDLSERVVDDDAAFYTASAIGLVVSLVLLSHGERLLRPVVALLSALTAAIAAFVLSRSRSATSLPCEARLVLSGTAALLAAALVLCVLRSGLFLLGALALGSIGHFVWESLPLEHVTGPFDVAGRPGWYLISVSAASVVGAAVALSNEKKFIRASSSVAGGTGVSAVVFLVTARAGSVLSPLAILAITLTASVLGMALQHCLSVRKKKQADARDAH